MCLLSADAGLAQQVDIGTGSVVETVKRLRPGEYVWAPQVAPEGPALLIVNLKSQRGVLYRNGVPIAASTVSTGRAGYSTPAGIFTILQKQVEHYSRTYDNAPMPYMQRLTWRGVALHAGKLPGYPASHGCIRLPPGFAERLYGVTRLGMTVVITDAATTPRLVPVPGIAQISVDGAGMAGKVIWRPERSREGPISIVISIADQKAIVLRNGVEIGSAPVQVDGPTNGTWAYTMRSRDAAGQHWTRVSISTKAKKQQEVPREEWKRFNAPDQFRREIAAIVEPGTTIVVTTDALEHYAGAAVNVLEAAPSTG